MTPQRTSNPNRDIARLNKAIRLADAIAAECQGDSLCLEAALEDDASALRRMDRDWWKMLAKKIGVHPPSDDTIEVVIDLLRRRLEPAPTEDVLFPDEVELSEVHEVTVCDL